MKTVNVAVRMASAETAVVEAAVVETAVVEAAVVEAAVVTPAVVTKTMTKARKLRNLIREAATDDVAVLIAKANESDIGIPVNNIKRYVENNLGRLKKDDVFLASLPAVAVLTDADVTALADAVIAECDTDVTALADAVIAECDKDVAALAVVEAVDILGVPKKVKAKKVKAKKVEAKKVEAKKVKA